MWRRQEKSKYNSWWCNLEVFSCSLASPSLIISWQFTTDPRDLSSLTRGLFLSFCCVEFVGFIFVFACIHPLFPIALFKDSFSGSQSAFLLSSHLSVKLTPLFSAVPSNGDHASRHSS